MPNFARKPFLGALVALQRSSSQCVSLSERGLLLAAGNVSAAYAGRNTGRRRGVYRGAPARGMPFRVRVRSAPPLKSYGSGLDWIDRRAIAIMPRSTNSLHPPLPCSSRASFRPSSKYPKKKTPSPNVKEKRKAGTRAGLTKAAIVAAAAKLIESVGANGGAACASSPRRWESARPRSISISKAALEPSSSRGRPAGPGRRHPAVQAEGGARRLPCRIAPQDNGGAARSTGRRQARRLTVVAQNDCVLVADGVSEPDGISRGPRRRDRSGRSGKAISSGRRRIRGPVHRNPRRQVSPPPPVGEVRLRKIRLVDWIPAASVDRSGMDQVSRGAAARTSTMPSPGRNRANIGFSSSVRARHCS